MVTIGPEDQQEYVVHPLIVDALTRFPEFYFAGTVGPDAFPDVPYGQAVIHDTNFGTWLTRILDMAWAAQSEPTFSGDEKSQILAWSYGFLTHAAGDHWAHTLVNEFAEGVFPAIGEVITDGRAFANAFRHTLIENYIGDATRTFDNIHETSDGETFRKEVKDDNGQVVDVSDDNTPGIPFNAPIRFIYEALIRPFPDDPTPIVEMKWEEGTLRIQNSNEFVRSEGSWLDDGFLVGHKITVQRFENEWNNDTYIISAVNDLTLVVEGLLIEEIASGDEKIRVFSPQTERTWIHVDADSNTFYRESGSFRADGFIEGQRFTVYGLNNYHGDYLVDLVSEDGRTLFVRQDLDQGDESGNGNEQLVVFGKRGPVLDKLLQLRDAVETAAIGLGPRIELGPLTETLVDNIVQGVAIDPSLTSNLFRAYLYNWVEEINEGLAHWGEVGLAFTKALFDPQSRRDLQNEVAYTDGADTLENTTIRAHTEAAVGVFDVLMNELDDPNGDGVTTDSFINKHLLPMLGLPEELGVVRTALQGFAALVGGFLDPLQIALNPLEETIDNVRELGRRFCQRRN